MKDSNNHTIVVINDTPDQLELMAVILGDAGYLVLTAENAAEGLELARSSMPDLIISDVMMPGIDGIELCRMIREDRRLRSIPVLLVSALRKDAESIVEALKVGAEDYIEAPYEPMYLVAKATRLIERKRTENQLQFQAHLLDTVEQAVIAADLRGVVIYWNRFAQKLYGWSAAEAVGRNIIELNKPELTPQQGAEIMKLAKAGKGWMDEVVMRTRYGRVFLAAVRSSPIKNEEGNLIGVVGVSIDITEKKEAENALREANQRAIREYDRLLQRLSTLAQTTGAARDLAGVFRAILKFTRESVPCSALCISLYEQENSARKIIYVWYNDKEMDVSRMKSIPVGAGLVGQAIESGEVLIVNDYQTALSKSETNVAFGFEEDARYPRSTIIAPMKVMGNPVGVIEVQSYDLDAYTEEHAAAMRMAANLAANAIESLRFIEQERVRTEQLQLSQKLESVGRLAGGIAHDFNNMLTAINGYSDLTLRRLSADDPVRRNIEEIKKAGERSAALTQQLLAFSRRQVLKPKVLDINHEIIEVSSMLKRLIGEDIQLLTNLSSKLGRVEADPAQLAQVIINLAVNARDAMPHGGHLSIETSNVYLDEEYAARHIRATAGSYVVLTISDNGSGIDAETLAHIFEPFYTTKETGKGTGLRLATVYGFVKQSNGYIWVYSEPGKGTTFKIYLPRIDFEALAEETDESSEQKIQGTETILLVEDEEVVRNLSRQILETCGYKVIEASDGSEALAIFEESDDEIDLVMTDVVMPKMGGRQLVEHLETVSPDVKVLYMSGYTDDAVIRQGIIETSENFIQKPFTFNALALKVRELLDSKN